MHEIGRTGVDTGRRRGPVVALIAIALGVGAGFGVPGIAAAQDADPAQLELGKRIWTEKVRCNECHGWSANGVPDDGRQPVGANLRETQLSPEQIREVIQCGRPGTEMPFFDARAYKDDRCYGVTADDLGDQVPPSFGVSLIGRELDAITAYVVHSIQGRGEVTAAECNEYFGEGNQACERYGFTADQPDQN